MGAEGDEGDDLARAVGQYGDDLRRYVQLEQQIQRALPAQPPRRSPLLMVAAVLTLIIPSVFFGAAAAGLRFGATTPTEIYLGADRVWPCAGVVVNPGDDLQAMITAAGTGTTFCLKAGTHRITAAAGLTPKTNDKFIGEAADAIITGSKLVPGPWTVSGSNWFATGFLPATAPSGGGTCAAATPLCNQPHDIFRNGTWLSPVASQGALAAGKVYLDYPNNRIYVRDNPTAATMEQSWSTHLLTGTGTGVTIKNLVLQHAASLSNDGALSPSTGTGWIIDHNEVRWNHSIGVGPGGSTTTVTANNVHHNGQDGVGVGGNNNLVQANEMHHNSYAGYDVLWDGGNKLGKTNLRVTGNYVHDEIGVGIWCDIDCDTIEIDNNYVANTQRAIMFEISCRALIHHNIVAGTSDPAAGSWGGIGILTSASESVEIYNNQVYDSPHAIWAVQQDRGTGTCTGGTEHVVKNLNVHNNQEDFNFPDPPFGAKTGLWTDTGRTDLYSTLNNHFTANTYYDTTPSSEWDWGMTSPPYTNTLNFANWQAAGHDTAGSVVNSNPTPPAPPTLSVGPQAPL